MHIEDTKSGIHVLLL